MGIEKMGIMQDIPNRVKLTYRKDNYIISTIKSLDNWYGKYETAIIYSGYVRCNVDVVKGYETEEEAIKGHEEYEKMATDEIERLERIG